MISPDDIGERRQTNNTPTLALVVAAVLLLAVGGMSYREFVRSSMEKEFAAKEERLMRLVGQGGDGADAVDGAAPAGASGTVLYDAQGNPVYVGGDGVVQPAGAPSAASLPKPEDPDISRMSQSLEQARELGRITEERFNQIAASPAGLGAPANGGGSFGYTGPAGDGAGGTEISSDLPDFLRIAVENPPGGNPEIEAQLSRMRAQVTSAPSLAKVVAYDNEWSLVTFNAGAAQGVRADQRFAVRRGAEVIGWIRVEEVGADQSVGTLVTRNRESDIAVKPELGDDLIDFELF
jgi:hypothetical protein